MSDDDDFIGDENDGDGIKNLRSQYKAQKKLNDEVMAKLAAYEQRERQTTVASVLKTRGVDPKFADLYSGDDASEDAVGKWTEQYFGATQAAAEEADANAVQAARVTGASYGNPEVAGKLPSGKVAGDPVELMRLIQTQPYEELVRLGLMPDPKKDMFKRPVGDY